MPRLPEARKYRKADIFIKYNFQNNGAQQLASEATIFIVLEDVNDEIPLFTEREQETVMEGEPIGTPVTRYEDLVLCVTQINLPEQI